VYGRFVAAYEKARAEWQGRLLQVIEDRLPDNPRLALELLGRRDPDWTPAERRMLSGRIEQGDHRPIVVKVGMAATITPDVWGKLPAEEQARWQFDGGAELYFDRRYEGVTKSSTSSPPG